ncbi:MAG: hypothetical protein K0S81_563 [Rhodospirillales bacterium]|nr:hypothetical protein [Rhodospirillales bacterium]
MLDGVSFQVHSRRGVCLIGSSGSGKSTLLRCANPLEPIERRAGAHARRGGVAAGARAHERV